jgi:hypothetical protein
MHLDKTWVRNSTLLLLSMGTLQAICSMGAADLGSGKGAAQNRNPIPARIAMRFVFTSLLGGKNPYSRDVWT